MKSPTAVLLFSVTASYGLALAASAAELRGDLEIRIGHSASGTSWTNAGLGKAQFDNHESPALTSRGVLRAETELVGDVSAAVAVNADGNRRHTLDVQEAWLSWNPIPTGPWGARLKAGSFFPPMSLEVAYDTVDWYPTRTLSSSAINSWVGDELRINGVELAFHRRGALAGSPHDLGVTIGMFGANDPAGTLLAWRGWTIGDRITGLTETIRLADLPVFRASGAIPRQTRDVRPFREIDGQPGFYAALRYARAGAAEVNLLHYDNRGHPRIVDAGQYSWRTRFDHLSLKMPIPAGWELLLQALSGDTVMGPNAVNVRYQAAYVLASHAMGIGQFTIRVDGFRTLDRDRTPADPNQEHGRSVALAYRFPIHRGIDLYAEELGIISTRPARALIGVDPGQHEYTSSVAVRCSF